ncbi:hypothetical protein ACC733_38945, partial [Rhizobium johnstonii]
EQRQCAAASRSYLERRGHPRHPGELQKHSCIGWRPRPDTAPYRWEFTENDRAIATLHSFRFFGLVFILPGVVDPNLP